MSTPPKAHHPVGEPFSSFSNKFYESTPISYSNFFTPTAEFRLNSSGVFGSFFLFAKSVHYFCRTFFQTSSGFGGQPRQSADRRLFAGNLFQDICALTSGQAAEKHHGQMGCDRCLTTFGQSERYFFWDVTIQIPQRRSTRPESPIREISYFYQQLASLWGVPTTSAQAVRPRHRKFSVP